MRAALRLASVVALPLLALAPTVVPVVRSGVPARTPGNVCRGKPAPAIGEVVARVVDRPGPDRALVEATWRRGPSGSMPRVTLVLPEGSFLVPDPRAVEATEVAPPDDRDEALYLWQVQFPTGAPLDAVVRLAASTFEGPVSVETAVRLTD